MENIYLPKPYKLLNVEQKTAVETQFTVEFDKEAHAGQFVQVSLPMVGECPISLASINKEEQTLDLLIRKVGVVTDAIFNTPIGGDLHLRGPFGKSFPIDQYKGKHLVVVSGGSGIAPVQPIIKYFEKNPNEVKSLSLISGFRDENNIIFKEKFEEWSKISNFDITVTVDKSNGTAMPFEVKEGLVTKWIEAFDFKAPKEDYIFVVVGPPMMMKFSTLEVSKHEIKDKQIWVSFERNMSCAVGKCGHCKIDETYICLEGPVFNYEKAKTLLD
ncbi:MAG: anaerobic sulfite reductase subunit AsrB [Culicoidibacterales bacterium]